jgi:hypothetical protein
MHQRRDIRHLLIRAGATNDADQGRQAHAWRTWLRWGICRINPLGLGPIDVGYALRSDQHELGGVSQTDHSCVMEG